ncbi:MULTISPECIES: DUF1850 domain-containing protein [Natrialbaceae]|uniref:DUF1850 domain-containing protein n=1 Tax=Natrialbaceae TaxID=1644061 RepID=UPI00207D22F2|nr:DUF1850 domain-containing protein [Natronococcus sp. CG52]
MAGASTVALSSVAADRTLVVDAADSEERLLEIPVDDGDEVALEYMHSVERTPVEDVYVVDWPELRAERMVFHSHGAGLPTKNVERTDEGFVVEGTGTYEKLRVSPGSIAGHELVVNGERYDLVDRTDGNVVLSLIDANARDALESRLETMFADHSYELIDISE